MKNANLNAWIAAYDLSHLVFDETLEKEIAILSNFTPDIVSK